MGTEIKPKGTQVCEKISEAVENLDRPSEIAKKVCSARKCICGCNAPMLYGKRECNIPYSTPRANFKTMLNAFFKGKEPPALTSGSQTYEIYDFFHIILRVKSQFGRLSWRKVSKALGAVKSTSEFRRPLRKYYKTYLKDFENWTFEKGPVSIGCIGNQLVIIILKEFLPCNLLKEKENQTSADKSTENEPQVPETPNSEIQELVDSMISDIEAGKVLIKRRKLNEDSEDLLSVPPIFIIRKVQKDLVKEPEKKPEKELKKEKKIRQKPIVKAKKIVPKAVIKNPMTEEFRDRNPASMGYRTDFRKGYLPIEMQEEHEILEKLHVEHESKGHFIRKKQSAVNIKRSCGVTYVKPTESKQKGVRHEFTPLPPLAFQVGTVNRIIPEEEKPLYFSLAQSILTQILNPESLLRVTVHENYLEEDIKNCVLGFKNDGEEIFVQGLSDLWRVLGKDNFVIIHFCADEKFLIVPSGPGKNGDVKIGFLVKKGLCGMRSVKRCLGLAESENDPLNMYATQIRLELYISRELWKKSLSATRKMLCAFISEFEGYVQKLLGEWNNCREEVQRSKRSGNTEKIFKWEGKCECFVPPLFAYPQGYWEYKSNSRPGLGKTCTVCNLPLVYLLPTYEKGLSSVIESKSPPNWYYLINTRDSFSYDLKVKKSYITVGSKKILKKEFFFHKDDLPSNYKDWANHQQGDYVKTGVITFHNCFTNKQLNEMEKDALNTEQDFLKGHFLRNTAQPTHGAGGKIKRTKFFFGTRYMWTATQLAEKQSRIAAGVRVDVSETPSWLKEKIEKPLVEAGILEKGFINSIAMNIYHDGKEGLAQHFDDAVRFKQPIFTVKLDSDSRLSFGSQFYGYLNGAFCIPCPRGAICELEEFSYAANSAKHCVRPCDLAGRSITVILRQIHPFIMEEAMKYDQEIDLPTWFSCLSLEDDSVDFASQKERQAKETMKCENTPKASY